MALLGYHRLVGLARSPYCERLSVVAKKVFIIPPRQDLRANTGAGVRQYWIGSHCNAERFKRCMGETHSAMPEEDSNDSKEERLIVSVGRSKLV